MMDIFVGSSANGEDSEIESVLEYTLRKNASREIRITWMRQSADPSSFWYGWDTRLWSTPFSGFRWAIPEYKSFQGKAIYMDCDMINFRDIAELWNTPLHGKPFAARRGKRFGGHEFCVMVIDCEVAAQHLIPVSRQKVIAEYHGRCIAGFTGNSSVVFDLDPRWNCLDGEDRELSDIWHLHWTNMATQPWAPSWYVGERNPHPRKDLVNLFHELSQEATQNGFPPKPPSTSPIQYRIIGK